MEPGQPQDLPLRRRTTSRRCAAQLASASTSPPSTASTSSSRSARRWRTQANTPHPSRTTQQRQSPCAARPRTTTPTTPRRACGRIKRTLHARILRAARRLRQRRARSDLHRRPAARGLDADRADPVQPLAGRRHDGAAGDHLDHARRCAARATPRSRSPTTTCWRRSTPTRCARSASSYLERTRIHRKTGAPFFIDKMPNNFAHIGLIHLALPNAKIIDARRHPLACCFSGFKQHFARGQNFSYGLDDIGRYYRDYVELMAHFDAVLPGRVHRVHLRNAWSTTPKPKCGACSITAACRSRTAACASSRTIARCAPPVPNRCAGRSTATASTTGATYEPWLDPLKAALGPVLEAYPASPTFAVTTAVRFDVHLPGEELDATFKTRIDAKQTREQARRACRWPRPSTWPSASRRSRRTPRRRRQRTTSDHAGADARHGHGDRAEAHREPAEGADQHPGARQGEARRAERHRLRRLRRLRARAVLRHRRRRRRRCLHARRGQRRQQQPLRPAAQRRRVPRRAADHHHRRRARHPPVRHRPRRGARRPAGHPVRRQLAGGHAAHHHQQARPGSVLGRLRRSG